MIVFPVLALGLALLGIGSRFLIKHDAARRAQVNDRGRHEGRDGLHRQESVIQGQEFHSFVSVVSDQGTLRGEARLSRSRARSANVDISWRSCVSISNPCCDQQLDRMRSHYKSRPTHEGMKKTVWRASHSRKDAHGHRFYLAAAFKKAKIRKTEARPILRVLTISVTFIFRTWFGGDRSGRAL